jgi:hypothetical protein
MKSSLPVILFAFLIASCGPSESELRAELQSIDRELMELRAAAYRYQTEMGQAEFAAFINSFAAGYGATSGDYGLASDGAGGAYNAVRQHDASSYSLAQIRSRQQVLGKRRAEVITELN